MTNCKHIYINNRTFKNVSITTFYVLPSPPFLITLAHFYSLQNELKY